MTRDNATREQADDPVDIDDEGTVALPDPDALFQALSVSVRRRCLTYLLEESETTTEALADVLAGWQSTTEGVVGPDDRRQVEIELRHVHIPLLVNARLIEYDSTTGTIQLADVPQPVRDIVRYARRYERAVEDQQ